MTDEDSELVAPQQVHAYQVPPPTPQPIVYYQHVTSAPPRVQTIEKTSKFWKAQIAFSSLLVLVGLIALMLASSTPARDAVMMFGLIAFGGGAFWYFAAKAGAWWDHG